MTMIPTLCIRRRCSHACFCFAPPATKRTDGHTLRMSVLTTAGLYTYNYLLPQGSTAIIPKGERIVMELMTFDRKLQAYREGLN
jgi:hypothetical protein